MSERLEAHQQKLAASRAKLNDALDRIGDRGDEQIYSEGAQWTLRQLVIHLVLADVGHNRMLYHYAEGKEFIPADYDLERYNKRSVEKKVEMTLEQARGSLAQSRQELLEWFDKQADDSFLDKEGRHATLRMMTLSQIIDVMCGHEEGHANDILAMLTSADS
ncbi:MAG: DinB family protein [Anaerolineae bacterium]|nr:DinB family protein [Anaerolineae bacterium]